MKLRLMGTEPECQQIVSVLLETVPREYIRSVSGWYRNNRQTYSNEGRVYIDIDLPPAVALTKRRGA